jgi:hypothetical protein
MSGNWPLVRLIASRCGQRTTANLRTLRIALVPLNSSAN